MIPDISEFSYGYAVTESLIWDTSLPIVGAPIFPSLIMEGRVGGYDVAIPFEGLILFLQFKLSHYMVRNSTVESRRGFLTTPFYRMHIRPRRHSRQHEMLLELEANGHSVLYAAPKFHRSHELNQAYLRRTIVQQSLLISPSTIGNLPDNGDHHLSFRNGSSVYLCSEPQQIRGIENEESAVKELLNLLDKKGNLKVNEEVILNLSKTMFDIVLKRNISYHPFTADDILSFREMHPLQRVRFLARSYFGCEPVIIMKRTK